MIARVFVTLKEGVLDPQGKAVAGALGRLGFEGVEDARMGKYIELKLVGTRQGAEQRVKDMCQKLLANPVIEQYRIEIAD